MHTPNMHNKKGVLHEPTNVALSFPTVRPGDVVLQLHNHNQQACAINFSKHTVWEIEKWKSMSTRWVKPKPDKLPTNTTNPPTPPADDPPPLEPGILQHHVIQNLHKNGMSMILATVGPFKYHSEIDSPSQQTRLGDSTSDVNGSDLLTRICPPLRKYRNYD
jgi:hypothetical protein